MILKCIDPVSRRPDFPDRLRSDISKPFHSAPRPFSIAFRIGGVSPRRSLWYALIGRNDRL